MYDFMLTPEEQELKKETREFVRNEISSDFLRKMDKDEITYPREFVEKLGLTARRSAASALARPPGRQKPHPRV